jgi:ABC-type glycerol-3-phosphate transport system substrate-binding protein
MKKQIVLLLAAILTVLAASCKKPADESLKGNGSKIDLGGMTIRVVAWWDDLPSKNALNEGQRRRYEIFKQAEENYNCKFESIIIPAEQIGSALNTAAMSGDLLGEIIFLRAEDAVSFAKNNYLLPLDDIFDMSRPQFNEDIKTRLKIDGKTYAFSFYNNILESMIIFNKDIFDRFDLESPYELMKKDQWTMSKMLEIATKVTKASSVNGQPTIWGLQALTDDPDITQILVAFGTNWVKHENGRLVSNLEDPKVLEALEFCLEMNVVHKATQPREWNAEWDFPIKEFMAGRTAMLLQGEHCLDELKKEMSDKFGVVPLPKGPGQKEYVSYGQSHLVRVMQAGLDKELAKKNRCGVYSCIRANS